jgi:TolB-like protein
MSSYLFTSLALLILWCPLIAQQRIAVLPFRNADGDIKYNVWCSQLSDSLRVALLEVNPSQTAFTIIPADSIDMAVSERNLDPTNPQYESDVWRSVEALGASKVVWGNFFLRNGKVLINGYVYDVATKIAHPVHQAKDIYKSPDTVLDAVRVITKKVYPGLLTE